MKINHDTLLSWINRVRMPNSFKSVMEDLNKWSRRKIKRCKSKH